MRVKRISHPIQDNYLCFGWVGGLYVEELGLTFAHAIRRALSKVTREVID